jgi:hypothetical protein
MLCFVSAPEFRDLLRAPHPPLSLLLQVGRSFYGPALLSFQACAIFESVADPDPGSDPFLTPVSGIRDPE